MRSKRRDVVGSLVVVLVVWLMIAGAAAWAADGDLEPTFDGDGKVVTDLLGTVEEAHGRRRGAGGDPGVPATAGEGDGAPNGNAGGCPPGHPESAAGGFGALVADAREPRRQ